MRFIAYFFRLNCDHTKRQIDNLVSCNRTDKKGITLIALNGFFAQMKVEKWTMKPGRALDIFDLRSPSVNKRKEMRLF